MSRYSSAKKNMATVVSSVLCSGRFFLRKAPKQWRLEPRRLLVCSSYLHSRGNEWNDVLEYWFEPGAEKKWFQSDYKVDFEIKEKFCSLVEQAVNGELIEWESQPMSSLALILLTDQFTRSIFRNTAEAFSGDVRARFVARKFLKGETHNHLEHSVQEKCFIYLPFEHSEDREDQELSVSLFSKMAEDAKDTGDEEQTRITLEFAIRHKEVIDKFGRYPQRNRQLGRENTPEEEDFLNNIPDRYKW